MENAVKRIGILTSGGDAPGMNAVIRSVVRTAAFRGIECIGIKRGYHGLIHNDMSIITASDVNGLTDRGGTVLYTARSKEFTTKEGLERAASNCRFMGIDSLVAIGGDGTFRGALELSEYGIPVVGIPATIDNDIACTSYTIGFDTACNTAIESIDKLRDTMKSHERCSVVEVMGRHSGYLAVHCAIASGATGVLIPEKEIDFERDVVEMIRQGRLKGRTHFMIVVAEGAARAQDIADQIHAATGIDTRVTILGHVQRGGMPQARDRVVGARMGYMAVQVLAEGKKNRVISFDGAKCIDMDMKEALSMTKTIEEDVYEIIGAVSTSV